MDSKPSALFSKVPTVKQATGSGWTLVGWRGVGAPKGLPADIQQRLVGALKKAHDSREFREFMQNRGYAPLWAGPEEFARFMAKSDADLGAVMRATGIAK